MIIPDILSLGGLVLGFAASFLRPSLGWLDSLLGVLAGGGVLYAIAWTYERLRKQEGMGGGDIKLLGMIGAFCGIKGVLFSLICGSFFGVMAGIPLMLVKREGAKYALPFGPFLSLGALLYAMVGAAVIRRFFHLTAR
jgi:leader peptidase (prepilin peptidase)/N-methyltransferase